MFANWTWVSEKDRPDAREFGDWTRKGPLPDVGGQRRVSDRAGFGSGARNFDSGSDVGSERGGRRPAFEGDGKVRDFGNWDRKGPLTPTLPTGPTARSNDRPTSHDGPRDRRNSPAWGEGRSQDGSRPPRHEFVERPVIDRAPTAPEMDNQWRARMKPDAPAPAPAPATKSPALSHRELSTPPSPAAPAVRPKLNLAKRTVSEAPTDPAPVSASSDSKASPFGAAKPINTAAREREVEEKRQAVLREKKEAEDKAREEKKVAEEKAREEKRLAKDSERAQEGDKTKEKLNGTEPEKENGTPPAGKNYEILRRAANEDGAAADDEVEENANGSVVDDKAIKPKEIIRDVSPKTKTNGASTNANSPAGPTADALEDEGWSTVSKPVKKGRNGNQAARAIAS